jgi:tRNA A37 threonylcarbamoyltransferase TsaD
MGSSFEEKELEILRKAVDNAQKQAGQQLVQSPHIVDIIKIVETFLQRKKLICYGGTAINNILPKTDQFYDKSVELPDYDFYSSNALKDAKELADIYFSKGYVDVEAKAGVHVGTYKVFVNFIPVADITHLDKAIFNQLMKETIRINGIHYAPPNFLRMSMYLELSRPKGDVSRWEKVLKRLTLLNKHYPMKNPKCNEINFMRSFEGIVSAIQTNHNNQTRKHKPHKKSNRVSLQRQKKYEKIKQQMETIYRVVRDSAIHQGLVFFGGFATSLFGKYMPKKYQQSIQQHAPDFDLLAEDPETTAIILRERLEDEGIINVQIYKKQAVGEIISPHYEIVVGKETIAFIYKPLACHSYNTIKMNGNDVNIATIDTMLSFYLAFLYADRPYYDPDRIFCMSQYLFNVQIRNRLQQQGVLKRFSLNCYGEQETLESIRNEKAMKYKELKDKKGTPEYDHYFLRYIPAEQQKLQKQKQSKTRKQKLTKKQSKTRKQKNE